jgi:hypothetical protein
MGQQMTEQEKIQYQRDYRKNYYRTYRLKDSWKQYQKQYNLKHYRYIKKFVIDEYGKVCAICGEKNFDRLSIDHINNDGGEHRKSIGIKCGGLNFYLWLIKNDYPVGYQTLCISCNSRKNAVWMKKNHIGIFGRSAIAKGSRPADSEPYKGDDLEARTGSVVGES